MEDLISFLRAHPRGKREDLAGEVLALLLREEPGQALLRELLKEDTDEQIYDVKTRLAIEDCVPDIHLIRDQQTLALIELKFDAGLTANQSSGRYTELAGRVIFIVPEERTTSAEFDALVSVYGITLLSWRDVCAKLGKYAMIGTNRDNRLFLAALVHLKEFCKVIEQRRFAPFSNEELIHPEFELTVEKHLVWLTREVLSKAKQRNVFQDLIKVTAGYDETFYYGQSVTLNGYRVWFGYWPLAWRLHPIRGPLWIQYSGRDEKRFLDSFPENEVFKIPDNGIALPLFVVVGNAPATQEEEVQRVLEKIDYAVTRLKQVDLLER
jgi:hypothetical protein